AIDAVESGARSASDRLRILEEAAHARDAQRAAGQDPVAAVLTSGAPTLGASARASAASRSGPAGGDREASSPGRQGMRDRRPGDLAAAAAGSAPPADAAEPTTRRPWRIRYAALL